MRSETPHPSFFERVAPKWDSIQADLFGPAVREAHSELPLQPDDVVLDVGCGTGYLAEAFLGRARLVVGVDATEAMLEVARGKVAGGGGALVAAGAEALPLKEGSAGRVVANMLLHHVEEPPKAVEELARVLASGGWLSITDLDAHPFEALRSLHDDRWLGFDRAEVEGWLQAAGLAEVSVESTGCVCRCETEEGQDEIAVTVFLARGRKT